MCTGRGLESHLGQLSVWNQIFKLSTIYIHNIYIYIYIYVCMYIYIYIIFTYIYFLIPFKSTPKIFSNTILMNILCKN